MTRKSKPVQERRKKDKNVVGVITVEQQVDMRRAARRQFEIDNATTARSGAGYHNNDMRKNNRKERREGKLNAKRSGGDNV